MSFKSELSWTILVYIHCSLPALLSTGSRSMFGAKDVVVDCCPSSLPCVRGTATWQLRTLCLPNLKWQQIYPNADCSHDFTSIFSAGIICGSSFKLPCCPKAPGQGCTCSVAQPSLQRAGDMGSQDCDRGDTGNTSAAHQGRMGRQRLLFPHLVTLVLSASPCAHPRQGLSLTVHPLLWLVFVLSTQPTICGWLLCSSLCTQAALPCVSGLGSSQPTRAAVASHHSKSL